MDRQLPREVIRRRWIRRITQITAAIVAVIVVGWMVNRLLGASVDADTLQWSRVDRGTVETSITTSGQVVAAREEIILSPITSRILEVCHQSGDVVEEGTPLLRLNLSEARTEVEKMRDEGQKMRLQLEQLRVQHTTALSDLKMHIRVDSMKVGRLQAELEGEHYLDSLGSGTADKVRQARLALRTAELELEQSRLQLEGMRQLQQADLRIKTLELQIFEKNLRAAENTLRDAEVRSPRRATVTRIVTQVGAHVSQGSELAAVADLSHFVVKSQLAENMATWAGTGTRVRVKVAGVTLEGKVGQVDAASQDGLITFQVQLDEDNDPHLRPGLRAEVYLMSEAREDVLRIAYGQFGYKSQGEYQLFVRTAADCIEQRTVMLGNASYDHIEVISGLQEGDEVVVSDMKDYIRERTVELKQ